MEANSGSENRITALISAWRADPSIAENITAWRTRPAQFPRFVPFPGELHPHLIEALAARSIHSLYSHQATAWEEARAGRNVVVVTGTASGKTLCYNLPVLDRMFHDPEARALYLFPTKALAHDQVTGLQSLLNAAGEAATCTAAAYDGDTRADLRAGIRAHAQIVVSNPDMLHTGILPHHTLWADLFRHLRFVVLDEMHVYRGVFGSHVANLIRRLKRIARFYGSKPQFILTSATIANPQELAERLIEEQTALVDEDGAARGEKHFLILNPPIVDRALGLRRSSVLESVQVTRDLIDYDIQTIVFARSRRTTEIVLRYLNGNQATANRSNEGGQVLTKNSLDTSGLPESEEENVQAPIRGYRSGYLPLRRREIERGLRSGQVRTVVATNALELGVDIGGLGAAILVGYPGSIAGTWQQAGRAGRHEAASLAVLVASADPLDQFLAHNPDYFFARSPEQALINPDNLLILLQHLRCAAFELPFRVDESFGGVSQARLGEFLQVLLDAGLLHKSGGKYFWMADQYPAADISLRSASAETVVLQAEGVAIGEVDLASAYWMVHPEAIYLHEGESYLVEDLGLEKAPHVARLRRVQVDYYTEPKRETSLSLLDRLSKATIHGGTKSQGEIAVTTLVSGFRKVKWYTHENLGEGIVSLPPTELHTTGYWIALNEETVELLRAQGMWASDLNDYGPGWPSLRDQVRLRDGFRCQSCGVSETELGRQHHVHHKIPFRVFATIEQANALDNLVTLCNRCHRRVELAVRLRSGLAGLAYVLGHLAPLFVMADRGDLGVHSDPESSLAEGRPAVVLYDLVPAGIGLSERLFELHDDLVARALELVQACDCREGCPSCVGVGGENGYGGKRETVALLQLLTGKTVGIK